MKKVKSIATPLIFFLFFAALQLNAQQTFKTTKKSVIGYLEYLPKDYASNSNKYPVVIFLHGIGERGANSTNPATLEGTINKVAKLGPPKYAKAGEKFPFILISPQLKSNYGNWPTAYVMEVVDYVKTYLRVDEKQIHITGLSLGGGGTWTMAQDFSKLFASVAPVCGGYNATSKAGNIAKENLPIWAFHGDKDPTVGLSKSANMVNAINASKPVPNPRAIMTVYPGVKHNAWDKAYVPTTQYHNPNVYTWMMKQTNTVNGGNKIPTANAGKDITHNGTTLTIKGSGTDPGGSIKAYNWTKISGPAATLTDANKATLKLSGLKTGTYMFKLQVTDNGNETDSDYVKVTIGAGGSDDKEPTSNIAPVANAGADKTITLPTNSITISGSGSDSDGSIASYSWAKVSGGAATMGGATTNKLALSKLVEGTYVFRLTVKDNKGATSYNDMKLTVKPAAKTAKNKAPVANAGKDITTTAKNVTIKGSGTDSDGKIASYTWTKITGGAASLSGANTATLKVNGLAKGWYVFKLVVKDDKGATDEDKVGVRIN